MDRLALGRWPMDLGKLIGPFVKVDSGGLGTCPSPPLGDKIQTFGSLEVIRSATTPDGVRQVTAWRKTQLLQHPVKELTKLVARSLPKWFVLVLFGLDLNGERNQHGILYENCLWVACRCFGTRKADTHSRGMRMHHQMLAGNSTKLARA